MASLPTLNGEEFVCAVAKTGDPWPTGDAAEGTHSPLPVQGMTDGFAQASGKAVLVNLHSAAGVGNAMGNISPPLEITHPW